MNGMNMNQFVLGFALARPLAEQRDRLMVGLTASMFQSSNPIGAVFLKPQVDKLANLETENANLRAQLAASDTLKSVAESGFHSSRNMAKGVNTDTSPAIGGAGDVVITPLNPTIATATWDSNARTITINRVGNAKGDASFTIEAGGRKLTLTRSLKG